MLKNSKQNLWDKNYVTGIDEIDEQHRILVNTLNEAQLKLRDDTSRETLESITKDLLSYALYHFETEEEMMQEHDYKAYSEEEYTTHMQQHRNFSAKVVAIRDSIKAGKPVDKDELIDFLTKWLVNHINNTDKKLAHFLQGNH